MKKLYLNKKMKIKFFNLNFAILKENNNKNNNNIKIFK